jgi:hypothetical protein
MSERITDERLAEFAGDNDWWFYVERQELLDWLKAEREHVEVLSVKGINQLAKITRLEAEVAMLKDEARQMMADRLNAITRKRKAEAEVSALREDCRMRMTRAMENGARAEKAEATIARTHNAQIKAIKGIAETPYDIGWNDACRFIYAALNQEEQP